MADSTGDRNHPATPARLQRAREEGDFAKSLELAAALQMLGAVLVAFICFGGIAVWLRNFTESWYSQAGINSSEAVAVTGAMSTTLFNLTSAIAPALLLFMLFAIASHWIQSGPTFLPRKVAPDLSRVSPMGWARRLFSVRSMSTPFIGMPKTLIAMAVAIGACWTNSQQFFELAGYPADQMVVKLFGLVLMIAFYISLALLLTALLDFGVNWYSHQQKLRMTDQELRDELRMQNGDPHIQNRRRVIRDVTRQNLD